MPQNSQTALAPKICKKNPGIGTSLKCAFANNERTWSENVDLLEILAALMREAGHSVQIRKGWLEVAKDFIILPQIHTFAPLEPSGVRTCSTIEVRHSDLIPEGIFEYQHSTGEDLKSSLSKGFEAWLENDFSVLSDAVIPEPKTSFVMQKTFPAAKKSPPLFRRFLLGPVLYAGPEPVEQSDGDSGDEHPPFCPCCMFTAVWDHLEKHLKSPNFYALRFFAARNAEGESSADCRINGLNWKPGKQALLEYVGRWPGQWFEYRKQYAVLQFVEGPFAPGETEQASAD